MDEIVVNIQSEADIYLALSRIRASISPAFLEVDQQAVFVTVLELCRNVVNYAGGTGTLTCRMSVNRIEIQVRDRGPGIPNLADIMSGRYTSSTGLGLGLLGSKRLMDELYIDTSERGTTILAYKTPYRLRKYQE